MQDNSEEESLIKEIQSIVYPSYPLGCSSDIFLKHYEPLFDALKRFDRSTDLSSLQAPLHLLKREELTRSSEQEADITEHIVMAIIGLLNDSCSHCHRKEYSQRIFSMLGEFSGSLKDLAIGKQHIRISYWVQHLDIQNPTTLYYSIIEPDVLAYYDKLYQLLHYIPHRETLLLNYTAVIMAQEKFQAALKGAQNSLPLQHQLYLAVIASATYGCKYLWGRAVAAFFRAGGDVRWIEEGETAVPAVLQQMGKYSILLAYNFKQLFKEELFGCNSSESEYRLIALLWLSYYQALACLDLVFGFIPERFDYFKYLPNLPAVQPTIWSFEAVKKTEGMDALHQIRVAQEFQNLYSWDNDNEDETIKIEGARSIELSHPQNQYRKRIESLPDLRNAEIFKLGRAEEEEIFEKISNLQSLHYLRSIFQKYVHLGPMANNYTHRTHGSHLEDNMVLASEWDFEIKGLNRIELVLGSKVRQGLQNLVGALRVQNNEKSKQLKHYYQFFNNYMYEYESYTKLMKEISINEKNYLKLITKSPFLFTEQAFLRMKKDLGKLGLDSLDFVMEAVSFKLQLSVNLLAFLFDRAAEESNQCKASVSSLAVIGMASISLLTGDDMNLKIIDYCKQIMINSYFRNANTATKPSLPSFYTTNRIPIEKPIAQLKYKKYKLFILIIARATIKTLKLSFEAICENSKTVPAALTKMSVFCEKNMNLSMYLAFEKMKVACSQQKGQEKILKNVVNLLQRMEKYKLKQSFSKLILETSRNDKNFIENFYSQRAAQFGRKLAVLVKRQKKAVLDRIGAWSRFVKSYSKLRVILVIRGRLEKQAKQLFFSRVQRYLLRRNSNKGAQKEMGELRTQLQDMAVQLENKTQNIIRLQSQIGQLKVEQSNLSFNQNLSYGEYNNNRSRGLKTYSQKKLSFNDKSARGSVVGSNDELSINDMSIGSILGNLNRSRTGSISKLDIAGQCSCGFRAKYQKYKSMNESLKTQLEIVKEELQVAKDLNQHFTNQIKQYLTGESEGDYEKLRRENQALVDERDQLREKVFKYQKHINNLKAEFKVKMEELYRKVRKDM